MQIYIQKYGGSIRIRKGMFEISFYDDNQIQKKQKIAISSVESIWLHPSISLTSSVLLKAIEAEIDVVIQDKYGHPKGRIWSSKPSNTSLVQRNQLEMGKDDRGLKYVKKWLVQKMENQQSFLKRLSSKRKENQQKIIQKNIQKINRIQSSLMKINAPNTKKVADKIRGLEGASSRIYFTVLAELLPQSQHFNGRSRQPAKDPFNAFLNYGYGILYSRIERALLKAGVSPYIGFLHRDGYQYKSMVFDFIEPYRIYVEKVVFTIFSRKFFLKKHVKKISGGLSLDIEGKKLLVFHFNRAFEEKEVDFKGKKYSPSKLLNKQAKRFALILKEPSNIQYSPYLNEEEE